jgi:hypothetical protein
MTSTAVVDPSLNLAVPPRWLPTTCALVTRNPSLVKITAEPEPRGRCASEIVTAATDGPTVAATRVTTVE